MRRGVVWGGAIGPVAFISAWAIGGVTTSRAYSPVEDTISQLTAVGAPTRALMTAGMVTFGVAVPTYALALRRALPGPAWIAAAATGIATLGVAATPLDYSELVDNLHRLAAGAGYITLAVVPLFARKALIAAGHVRFAAFGTALAAVAAVALPTSLVVSQTGMFQRIGLTAGDLFLITSVPVVRKLLRGRPAA